LPARSRKQLEWSARAGRDLFDAWSYIGADSFAAADVVELRIIEAAERLLNYPALGQRGRVAGTRELPVARTSFTIVYRVGRRSLSVVRVLHQRLKYPSSPGLRYRR
jgi:plasmid stabilization system protein ParE